MEEKEGPLNRMSTCDAKENPPPKGRRPGRRCPWVLRRPLVLRRKATVGAASLPVVSRAEAAVHAAVQRPRGGDRGQNERESRALPEAGGAAHELPAHLHREAEADLRSPKRRTGTRRRQVDFTAAENRSAPAENIREACLRTDKPRPTPWYSRLDAWST